MVAFATGAARADDRQGITKALSKDGHGCLIWLDNKGKGRCD